MPLWMSHSGVILLMHVVSLSHFGVILSHVDGTLGQGGSGDGAGRAVGERAGGAARG